MQILKADTSAVIMLGPAVDKTDGVTLESGLVTAMDTATTGVRISKNGGAWADRNGTPTTTVYDEGWYRVTLNATDTNTEGTLDVMYEDAATCLPMFARFQVVNANVYDSLFAASGTDLLQVDTTQIGGTTQTARDIGASVLLSPGTGTGQISLASGAVTAGTVSDKTGYSLTATTGLGNQTANITGNLSGSVGSVTAGVSLAATATSAQLVDDVWDEVLNAASHNVAASAGRRLRTLQEFQGYEQGLIWIDTVNGTAGTTSYENGTVENPVDSLANATTISGNIGLKAFHIANGSTITLAQTYNNFDFVGQEWTLALGGQDIGGTFFRNVTQGVTGIATGTTPFFEECSIGNATLPPCALDRCGLSGTLTIGSIGDFFLVDCYSQVAGSSAPIIDMGAAVGATNISIRRWSGGLTLNNLATGDVVSVDVVSGGTITVNGTGGTVVIRGMCNVVDGSSGSVSITETSVVNMTKINAEADTAISDAGLATAAALATVDGNVDTIVASTLSTAAAAQLEQNLNNCFTGTASGTPTTTTMVSDIAITVDDQLKGRIITFDDDTTTAALRGQSTDITACTAASNTLTFTALTTAPVSGDTFVIT